ncbi:MAG TPA: hypothetical protein VKW08_05915 [Xanthobacteraceae bacterium]|jgi:hypothetical protein|nr:hypothetical protein [Xanthobacteraceae bacterium]
MLIYRALSAVAAAALGAAVMMALPGFSPPVSAGTSPAVDPAAAAQVTVGQDRPLATPCSEQAWPYYAAACLQDHTPTAGQVRTVRLVTTDRLPR